MELTSYFLWPCRKERTYVDNPAREGKDPSSESDRSKRTLHQIGKVEGRESMKCAVVGSETKRKFPNRERVWFGSHVSNGLT